LAEGYGLIHLARPRGEFGRLHTFTVSQAVVYETLQVIVMLAIVFVMARLVKALGETFHGRHSFRQTFTVAAYGLSPVVLLHALDAFPGLSPWVTWGIGIALAATVLYHGLPPVMQPDPPHAFGLYMMSILLMALVTGLVRFITAWYMQGKFSKLDALISRLRRTCRSDRRRHFPRKIAARNLLGRLRTALLS
jgi:hypothetical protein